MRHGESEWNLARRVQGQSLDAGTLTARGIADADAAAGLLARLADKAVVVISSDLRRAADTAEVIRTRLGLPIQFDSSVREQRLGALEGLHTDAPWGTGTVKSEIDSLWSDPRRRPDAGESVGEMSERLLAALSGVLQRCPDGDVIVVTHGGPIRALLLDSGHAPASDANRVRVPNGSITSFATSGDAGRPRLTLIERHDARDGQRLGVPDTDRGHASVSESP